MGKGRRKFSAKFGTCPHYANEKTRYFNRSVADFDCNVLQAKHPEFQFNVFKCERCRHWHVGRMTNEEAKI